MRTFVVCFDATLSVSVEAEEEAEATRVARRILSTMDVEGRVTGEGIDCTLGEIYLVEDRAELEDVRT